MSENVHKCSSFSGEASESDSFHCSTLVDLFLHDIQLAKYKYTENDISSKLKRDCFFSI